MSDINPILAGIRLELKAMAQTLAKMNESNKKILTEDWITKEQLMSALKICARTVETLKSSKKLPYSKIKGLVYFKVIDVEKLLNDNYVNPSSTDNNSIFKTKSHV